MHISEIFMSQEMFAFPTYNKDADREWPDDMKSKPLFLLFLCLNLGPLLLPLNNLYEHIAHSELDWSLLGRCVCRVVGYFYYG
jgi:hypothetical protein